MIEGGCFEVSRQLRTLGALVLVNGSDHCKDGNILKRRDLAMFAGRPWCLREYLTLAKTGLRIGIGTGCSIKLFGSIHNTQHRKQQAGQLSISRRYKLSSMREE